jgi:hypothetical protein
MLAHLWHFNVTRNAMACDRPIRLFLAVLICFGVIASVGAHAQGKEDNPADTPQQKANRAESCKMLQDAAYDQLDRKMNAVQQDYEAGKISDVTLHHLFSPFCQDDHFSEKQYEPWVAARPNSYAARLAAGIYLRNMAYFWRGTAVISKASHADLRYMNEYIDRAMADLKPSLDLTAKPLLTYEALVGLASLVGNRAGAKAMMDAAIKVDPKNFVVRSEYMGTSLTTRGGGSLPQMEAFRQEAQKAGLPPVQMAYFDTMIEKEKQWLIDCACQP